MNRIYSIFNTRTGTYWCNTGDINQDENYSNGFVFWFDRKLAEECLEFHQKNDSIDEYTNCYVVELEIENMCIF